MRIAPACRTASTQTVSASTNTWRSTCMQSSPELHFDTSVALYRMRNAAWRPHTLYRERSAHSSPRMLHSKGLHHDIRVDGHRQLLLVVARLKLGVLV